MTCRSSARHEEEIVMAEMTSSTLAAAGTIGVGGGLTVHRLGPNPR
jgi:hypothetical protein